jgi:hypothetical protein
VSAISPDALHELNAGVDDDSSGDESDALPPPAEPQPVKPTSESSRPSCIWTTPRWRRFWTRASAISGATARRARQLPDHQSAKALVGTIAPAPSIAVADLDELRRQVQIMATSANADVDDDDADNDAEETKMRAVPYKKVSSGHVAPAPTAATNQLEDFRAQAQAMGAAKCWSSTRRWSTRFWRTASGRVWRPADSRSASRRC